MEDRKSLSCYVLPVTCAESPSKISLHATKESLWENPTTSLSENAHYSFMLPNFKLSAKLLSAVWTKLQDVESRCTGQIVGFRYLSHNYLYVKLTQAVWKRTQALRRAGEITSMIYLVKNTTPRLEDNFKDKVIQRILAKIHRTTETLLEPSDICKLVVIAQPSIQINKLRLTSTLIYPKVSLSLSQIPPMKIVSNPIARMLHQRHFTKVQVGLVTMDTEKRALLMGMTDLQARNFPTIGIWISSLHAIEANSIVHPIVWSSCIKYILSNIKKISPNPNANTFLLINFTNKPRFYEVSTAGDPEWDTMQDVKEVNTEEFSSILLKYSHEPVNIKSRPKQLDLSYSGSYTSRDELTFRPASSRSNYTPSYSSSEGRRSIEESCYSSHSSEFSTESLRRTPSTKEIILEQSKVLKQLEIQIKELQAQIILNKTSDSGKIPNKAMVSSATNTTLYPESFPSIPHSKSLQNLTSTSTSANTSILPDSRAEPTFRPQILPDYYTEDMEDIEEASPSLYNPMTYTSSSRPLSAKPPRPKFGHETERTFYVPKIMYEAKSDSSEDEEIERLEQKYRTMLTVTRS